MKLISWNVNGLRAVYRKNSLEEIWKQNPDILNLQEIKTSEDQIPFDIKLVPNYYSFFNPGERKGYSGVALYSNENPKEVSFSFGDEKFDNEGRIIKADFDNFSLFNIYFPNGGASADRLRYKMEFYDSFLKSIRELLKVQPNIIICGDVNTAHREVDLAHPKQNENKSGFLKEEREWMDKFLDLGFHDSFRMFNSLPDNYSWWDMKSRARERNVGWRIDYFFVSNGLKDKVENAYILKDIPGSDHAPVVLEIKI